MNLNKFYEIVNKNEVKEPWLKNSLLAFFMGGLIGVLNQGLIYLYQNYFYFDEGSASSLSTLTIVFITSILTVTKVYKRIGKIFGAGLFVPTTGFANSITSSAIEGKDEGLVLGIGGKIFALAGAVITYGIVVSIFFLLLTYFLRFIGVNI